MRGLNNKGLSIFSKRVFKKNNVEICSKLFVLQYTYQKKKIFLKCNTMIEFKDSFHSHIIDLNDNKGFTLVCRADLNLTVFYCDNDTLKQNK